jgi:hypothetical protein
MIFLIEHEKGCENRFQILIGYDEIDPSEFDPIKNLFLCQTITEAMEVMNGLQEMDK